MSDRQRNRHHAAECFLAAAMTNDPRYRLLYPLNRRLLAYASRPSTASESLHQKSQIGSDHFCTDSTRGWVEFVASRCWDSPMAFVFIANIVCEKCHERILRGAIVADMAAVERFLGVGTY